MKTVFFESLSYKLITKNDFYYGSCPDIHITTPIPKRKISCCPYLQMIESPNGLLSRALIAIYFETVGPCPSWAI